MALATAAGALGAWATPAAAAGPQAVDTPQAVDVTVTEAPPARRIVAVEYDPVALLIDRISATIEIVPLSHHALVLSPFYFNSRTASFQNRAGSVVPSQRFEGVGGELGYRYYTGDGGPRGFFAGVSLIAVEVEATAADGAKTKLADLGPALDVGYQALVADDWVLGLGGGAQYTFTTTTLPDQQAPANVYANSGLHPRVLATVGYAF